MTAESRSLRMLCLLSGKRFCQQKRWQTRQKRDDPVLQAEPFRTFRNAFPVGRPGTAGRHVCRPVPELRPEAALLPVSNVLPSEGAAFCADYPLKTGRRDGSRRRRSDGAFRAQGNLPTRTNRQVEGLLTSWIMIPALRLNIARSSQDAAPGAAFRTLLPRMRKRFFLPYGEEIAKDAAHTAQTLLRSTERGKQINISLGLSSPQQPQDAHSYPNSCRRHQQYDRRPMPSRKWMDPY